MGAGLHGDGREGGNALQAEVTRVSGYSGTGPGRGNGEIRQNGQKSALAKRRAEQRAGTLLPYNFDGRTIECDREPVSRKLIDHDIGYPLETSIAR